jgi:2-dehydropantoate 2-reductase
LQGQFDLVLVSCKAHHLDNVISDLGQAPCLADSIVLPLLNGINQYDRLDLAFGRERVAGGLCRIATTLDNNGHVHHLNDHQQIVFGSRDTSHERTIAQFAALLAATSLEAVHSPRIMQEAWRKFTEISVLAAMTCLMRAPVGCINRTDEGSAFVTEILSEAAAVSERYGYPLDPSAYTRALRNYHDPELPLTASMLRDLEARLPTEAEHIIGDMYHRGRSRGLSLPLFRLAWMHMQANELRQLG